MLLARYPPIPGSNGRSTAQTANFQQLIAATDHGIVHIRSMLDGQDRLLAPRGLSHYPILVIAGTTSQQAMGGWRDQSLLIVASGVLLELFLCGLIVLSIRQMRAQQLLAAGATEKLASDKARMLAEANLVLVDLKLRHAEESKRSEQALNTQAMRFELALRNMQQGLMMFDDVGRLLVVNRPFCRLFGLEPDALIAGMSYAEVTGRIVELGNITERDMRRYRDTRAKLISGNEAATATWEVSDGRAFTVTHQAMEGGWLSTYEDITEHRKTAARIAHLANHDALTDLPNRVLFHERLEHGLTYARRGHLLALHCLDLDQFKTVNDTLGHPIGDRLLQAVAGRLLGHLRETDTVARLGGDEFAIVQTAIGSPTDASRLADKLIALIEAPFEIDGNQIVIGTSIGIAFAPHDGLDADQLLKCADLALYRAKVDGRGIYRLFHADMDASMQARRALELDLRGAMRDGQFELFYQPLVDLRSKRVAGFEALLRWRHPTKGLISPDRFIPLCEETGMIVQIGEWVLRQACATAAGWQGDLKVAVNLSAVQFRSHDLVATIVASLHESGLHPSRLELEITETVMLHETDSTLTTLHRLQELGIRIAMDDFGTGYSSLSYLRLFPFDRVKIDQSFVRELGKQTDCMAIVRAVATLGNDLGMAITAEGVETRQQLETLERAGCTEVQGYLFSRPVPWLSGGRSRANDVDDRGYGDALRWRQFVRFDRDEGAAAGAVNP